MTILHLQGQTDGNGDLHVHIGHPNAAVSMDVVVSNDIAALTQEQWANRFDELAAKVDFSEFDRISQAALQDPFGA